MMDVFVVAPSFRFRCYSREFPPGSIVRDVLERFVPQQDFYVTTNGHLSQLEDRLQNGAVYHLEPRLCGGKGGFGSMLRALGAQIEKTTNREACRDLSGRRLRDVNHEKEMADWLKKQAEREAEKEQRRLERLQRKLAEPKHQFTDPEYQQQCHDLSERLEDSVLKGLQVSSSGQVKVGDVSAAKRPNVDQNQASLKKKRKTAAAVGFWTGLGKLSSEDEDDEDDDGGSPPSSRGAAVTMTIQREGVDHEPNSSSSDCSSSSAGPTLATSENQKPGPPTEPVVDPPEDQEHPAPTSNEPQQLDLSSVTSVQQLESLGLGILKEELMRRGLKCGGTLLERAARLFSVRGLSPDQIDPALLAKPKK
ncbi:replication stress response regulator SDE2 isoform X2 [Girardinichthys multiradiatus]|uniref:replication stress response regulator SDE2 isoform X2 n=1 Tax=Girardinichthys multiradiatus TaxID=208333 RepID=UPI001FAD0898|nr:replication stress response regulator SDE2 isoform X2 [Girardinichthys multiradiatus]